MPTPAAETTTRGARQPVTWIAEIDSPGHEMERPFMRAYVEGATEDEALAAANRLVEAYGDGDVVRRVVEFQPILEAVIEGIASGKVYTIDWKHEGSEGPVVICDVAAFEAEFPANENGVHIGAVPFGTEAKSDIVLPWMRRADAKRLAKYLGLTLGES